MQHRTVDEHLEGLRAAVDAFADAASAAGPDADVPTCPRWTVRSLVAHQGMVHRWARANLRGEECHPPSWNAEGQEVDDPVSWLREGAAALEETLRAVPDDVQADVFLKDAPRPRFFWARRQCHETTIHAADAVAARLGRAPAPDDVPWIEEAVALDGIDEMLTGFVTRGRSRFAGVGPLDVTLRAADRSWTVQVAEDGAVSTTRDGEELGSPIAGSPVGLYLAVWNRAAPGSVDDPDGVLDQVWRSHAKVRWS
ncbi:maleylpyruvate isomerase family mycothiol-dependent enzyme [Ornithinimicrobium humiphilum]|uniref:maleylpyruvate isomerase family mycothiol-dependent enzyme n=1 Tax=Ornithinimicrobium humiphilum TaxID=125288 RepID=UPI001EE28A94|nr:maleylpyruvate isomerase family mycothiol-dependent enzyme [Ornithinimicrobium humiphilum]